MSANSYGELSNSPDAVIRRLEAYALTLEDLPHQYRLEAQRAATIIRRLQRELAECRAVGQIGEVYLE